MAKIIPMTFCIVSAIVLLLIDRLLHMINERSIEMYRHVSTQSPRGKRKTKAET